MKSRIALTSPRDRQVRAVKQVELQLLLLGAENTFHYQPSFFYLLYLLYLLSCNVGHSTSFPSCCWPTADYRASVLMRRLSRPGLAWPAGDPPPFIHTVHTYCPRTAVTACNALPGCWLLAALSHTACTSHDTGTVASGNSAHPPANHPIHPPTRPSARPSPSSLAYRSWW